MIQTFRKPTTSKQDESEKKEIIGGAGVLISVSGVESHSKVLSIQHISDKTTLLVSRDTMISQASEWLNRSGICCTELLNLPFTEMIDNTRFHH